MAKIYTVFKGSKREFTGNLTEIAKHFNIPHSTFHNYLQRGMSIEKIIDFQGYYRCNIHTVFKNTNREFTGNLTEIAKHFDINYSTLYDKFRRGISLEDIINSEQIKSKIYTILAGTNGEFTGTIKEICNHTNSNYSTVISRIRNGMDIEEATDKKHGRNNKITIFKNTDKEFTGNMHEICKHFNVNYSSLLSRLKQENSIEDAINYLIKYRQNNIYTVFENKTDKEYHEFTGSIYQIAKHFHLKYDYIKQFKNRNMTLEEMIIVPLKKVPLNNYNYNGKNYNLRDLCQTYNKKFSIVYNKIKYHKTIEYAIESTTEPYVKEEK